MGDNQHLKKEVIVKDEHWSEDEHNDNDPFNMLQAKSHHFVDEIEDSNKQTIEDFDSDEDLAGIQRKLRRVQQKATQNYSQHMLEMSEKEKHLVGKQRRRAMVENKCAVCMKRFNFREDFIRHARQYHPNLKSFQCSLCPRTFVNYHSVSRHGRNHKNMVKKHVCEYCSKAFLHRDTYKRHLEIHTRKVLYSCSLCDKSYKQKVSLKNHQKTHASSRKVKEKKNISLIQMPNIKQEQNITSPDLQSILDLNNAVDINKIEYIEPEQLLEVNKVEYVDEQHGENTNESKQLHMPNKCLKLKRYRPRLTVDNKCAVCHKIFNSRPHFIEHVKQHHPNSRAFKCNICSMRFSNIISVARHRRNHKNVARTNCPYCAKSFLHKDDFNRHISKVHSIKIISNSSQPAVDRKCAICHQEFALRQELIQHAQEFHPKQKAFKCNICSMVFTNIHYISRHRRNHKILPRKHICQICFKSFRDADNFQRHLQVHTKTPAFACAVCDKSYRYKESLRYHESTHLRDNVIKVDKMGRVVSGSFQRAVKTKCNACQKNFKCQPGILAHVKQFHQKRKALRCSLCPMTFMHRMSVIAHRRIVHKLGPKRHFCKICQKYVTAAFLGTHLKSSKHELFLKKCERNLYHQKIILKETATFREKDEEIFKDCNIKHEIKRESDSENTFEVQDVVEIHKAEYVSDEVVLSEANNISMVLNDIFQNTENSFDDGYILEPAEENVENLIDHGYILEPAKKNVCRFCEKSFISSSHLRRHLSKHTNERPYSCCFCNRRYKRQDDMKTHQRKIHPVLSLPETSLDETNTFVDKEIFIMKDNLRKNPKESMGNMDLNDKFAPTIRKFHMDPKKNNYCEICKKTFISKFHFNRHLSKHSHERPYNCSYCEKAFKRGDDMRSHISRMHKEEMLQANQDSLEGTNDFMDHFEKHPKESISNIDINNKFVPITKSIHRDTKKKNYCEICDKTFISKTHLNRHLSKHSNERPYNCSYCEKVFKRRDDMRSHQSRKHKEEILEANQNIDAMDFVAAQFEDNSNNTDHSYITSIKSPSGNQNILENTEDIQGNPFIKAGSYLKNNLDMTQTEYVYNEAFSFQINHDIQSIDESIQPYNKIAEDPLQTESNLLTNEENLGLYHNQSIKKEVYLSNESPYQPAVLNKTNDLPHNPTPENEDYTNTLTTLAGILEATSKKNFCELCCKSFHSKAHLRRHLSKHSKERPYQCSFCDKAYKRKDDMKTHQTRFHFEELSKAQATNQLEENTNDEMFEMPEIEDLEDDNGIKLRKPVDKNKLAVDRKCAVCKKEFNYRQDLIKHVQHYHPNAKAFKCTLCTMLFSNVHSIARHRRSHKELPLEKVCPYCSMTFNRMDYFRNHLKNHRDNRHYSTQQDNSFNEEENISFKASTEFEHTETRFDINLFDNVEKSTNSTPNLEEQAEDIEIKKEEICSDSDFQDEFEEGETSITETTISMKSRGRKPPMLDNKCAVCKQVFDFQRDLVNHAQELHPSSKALKCRLCDVHLSHIASVSRHFRTHKNLPQKYVCEFCFKPFAFKDYLKTHLKVHTTVKDSYSCSLCDKFFKRKDSLIAHQKTHAKQEAKEGKKSLEVGESTPSTTNKVECDVMKNVGELEGSSTANDIKQDQLLENISETLTRFKARHRLLEGKCAICKEVFNCYQDFLEHLEKCHPEYEAFKCKKCDNRFSNARSLSSHKYRCRNVSSNKYNCEFCSKSFERISNLKNHVCERR